MALQFRRLLQGGVLVALIGLTTLGTAGAMPGDDLRGHSGEESSATTPIEHLVVIFQENVSFDHYFGTYPIAANTGGAGEQPFTASGTTPEVNGLVANNVNGNRDLLKNNPNTAPPVRLTGQQALTCDQDHGYGDEQKAYGYDPSTALFKMNNFAMLGCDGDPYKDKAKNVMGYYDGNVVTGLWNYAQRYAMSDNSYSTVFGPSTPGALNLISGQTHGVIHDNLGPNGSDSQGTAALAGEVVAGTVVGDPRPLGDDCNPANSKVVQLSGRNIGDVLNENELTWGWFQGGFKATSRSTTGTATCGSQHPIGAALGKTTPLTNDYIPHHEPFQYFASTANPHHLPPSSPDKIGETDQAKHQYDLSDFFTAADNGHLPAVSFLKAAGYQDGHAGYSDPIDEQKFLVETINHLQKLPEWSHTAVVIAYDDSDGWYDHQPAPIMNPSQTSEDQLTGDGNCGTGTPLGGYQGRCGLGPRQPFLLISPYAKSNFVDHTVTDQASILRFIEDNWDLGRIGNGSFDHISGSLLNLFNFDSPANAAPYRLDPATGRPTS